MNCRMVIRGTFWDVDPADLVVPPEIAILTPTLLLLGIGIHHDAKPRKPDRSVRE